jgi:hypothetical protein
MKVLMSIVAVSVVLSAMADPAAGQQSFARFPPNDSLSPRELVEEWLGVRTPAGAERGWERSARIKGRGMGVYDALTNFRVDPERAEAVRDELERLATSPAADCLTILVQTTGVRRDEVAEDVDTRGLALRLERIYRSVSQPTMKRCALMATTYLGGSGRLYALTWLEPLIVRSREEQAFPEEALEALRAALRLGPAGRELVVRLRDAQRILDVDALRRAAGVGRVNDHQPSGELPLDVR